MYVNLLYDGRRSLDSVAAIAGIGKKMLSLTDQILIENGRYLVKIDNKFM